MSSLEYMNLIQLIGDNFNIYIILVVINLNNLQFYSIKKVLNSIIVVNYFIAVEFQYGCLPYI